MFRSKSSDKSKERKGSYVICQVYLNRIWDCLDISNDKQDDRFDQQTIIIMLEFSSCYVHFVSFSDAKSNGNVFGVALSQCVNNDDCRVQDENSSASGINRKDSNDTIGGSVYDRRSSPSGSISSTNDSGCSISPASPSSLYVN